MRREKLRGAEAVANKVAGVIFGDPAKALVMSYVRQLVADGHAEWDLLANGEIEVRFRTGDTRPLFESRMAESLRR
jgi:hypothetical protein